MSDSNRTALDMIAQQQALRHGTGDLGDVNDDALGVASLGESAIAFAMAATARLRLLELQATPEEAQAEAWVAGQPYWPPGGERFEPRTTTQDLARAGALIAAALAAELRRRELHGEPDVAAPILADNPSFG